MICGPILALWAILNEDLERTMNFLRVSETGFQLVVLASCILAFFLNYTIFLKTPLNSPLTQTN